jgi:hypothetical protein
MEVQRDTEHQPSHHPVHEEAHHHRPRVLPASASLVFLSPIVTMAGSLNIRSQIIIMYVHAYIHGPG